jgi:hypothetical protein
LTSVYPAPRVRRGVPDEEVCRHPIEGHQLDEVRWGACVGHVPLRLSGFEHDRKTH